jgi:hypothetical protein
VTDTSDDTSAPTVLPDGGTRAGAPERDLEGRIVADRYEVESLLGSGGMGAVYRAQHVHMRKTVALKVLHGEMTHLPEVVARFEREAIAAAHIQHPHVAAATDFGRLDNGSFYLVLEYVDGRSLRTVLDQDGRLSPPRAIRIAQQIAEALEAAHEAGIVHRDLKPDNVMLVERGGDPDFVKVLDFGIAKLSREETASSPALTQLGSVFGTPEYMSPEQAMGSVVDHRSDLYSLGIILYEMVSGATPFASEDSIAILTRHMTQPPPELGPEVPREVARSINGLLGKRPDERPDSARTVATELAALEAELREPPPPSSEPHSVPGTVASAETAARTALPLPAATATPPLAPAAGAGSLPLDVIRVLSRPLAVGQLQAPLWLVLGTVSGALLVGLFGILSVAALVGPRTEASAESASPSRGWRLPGLALGRPSDKSAEPPIDRAAARKTITRIEALPVYKRTVDDWRDLGAAHHDLGQYPQSVSAYRNAISKRRSLAKDPQLLAHLRRAGRDEDAAIQVITLSETLLLRGGGPGLDLMYQIWEDIRTDPKQVALAERYFKKLVILSQRGSDAAQVAIELHRKKTCEALLEVVGRAASAADRRSLNRLRELERQATCSRRDCYPCLRSSDALQRAIRRAEQRPGPSLGESD